MKKQFLTALMFAVVIVGGSALHDRANGGPLTPQGGTITSVSPGLGIVGGGTHGPVTVALNAKVISPVALTGAQKNNYAPVDAVDATPLSGAHVVSQDATADNTISGFSSSGIVAGFEFELHNISTHTFTLTNLDGASSGLNQMSLPGSLSWFVSPGGSAHLRWNGSTWITHVTVTTNYPTFSINGATLVAYTDPATTMHYEWFEEFLSCGSVNGDTRGPWTVGISGTGAAFSNVSVNALGGRFGICQASTGTTTSGRSSFSSGNSIDPQYTTTFAISSAFRVPTLDDGTDKYNALLGSFATNSAVDQNNGCWVEYDHNGLSTAPGTGTKPTGDVLGCWCANGGTRTAYPMNGVAVSDESFTTVNAPVAAGTWPSTNVLDVLILQTPGSRAEFYVKSGSTYVKTCDIATNLPHGNSVVTGLFVLKNAGTNARSIETDWLRLSYDLTSVRPTP